MGLLSGKKTTQLPPDGKAIREIPIAQIFPDPYQPRKRITAIEELAASIITTKGIQTPLHVIKKGEKQYQIITGERRYLAAKHLTEEAGENARFGESIPCIVHVENELSAQQLLQIQVIENLQREDLTPIEEARAYKRLVEQGEMSQAQVARELGVSRSIVSETIRILSLPEEFIEQLEQLDEMPAKRELFKIIREKSTAKQRKLMEALLQRQDVGQGEEEEESEEQKREGKPQVASEDQVWDWLKKAVQRDKTILLKLISRAKIEKLREIVETPKD